MRALARAIDNHDLPAVEKIAEESQEDPFEVLISTMLSAQTRDPVTAAASARLFRVARTPRTMAKLTTKTSTVRLRTCSRVGQDTFFSSDHASFRKRRSRLTVVWYSAAMLDCVGLAEG